MSVSKESSVRRISSETRYGARLPPRRASALHLASATIAERGLPL